MAGCRPSSNWRKRPSISPSLIATIITCSSHCCIKLRPPRCRPEISLPRFEASSQAAERQRHPGQGFGVDTARGEVLAEGRRIPFDDLIIATGAEHAYFGNDWAPYAPGLKTIDDATYLRRRILLAFERAETEPDADERRRLSNFVVVGGGPTGVEMAGAIAELAKRALASDFRSIDPRSARIILLEAGPRLLPSFVASLSETARRSLISSAWKSGSGRESRIATVRESRSGTSASRRARSSGPRA